ncbi:MAG: hypothetical protein HC945_02945 [Nitrosarchaeum sp.]|nr:hypothetical protein [Nitrosarchaeum sp.]
MALFGKDEARKALPVEHIRRMRQQGLSNNQIIETLQRDGFSSSQIFDAMNQLEIEPPDSLALDVQDEGLSGSSKASVSAGSVVSSGFLGGAGAGGGPGVAGSGASGGLGWKREDAVGSPGGRASAASEQGASLSGQDGAWQPAKEVFGGAGPASLGQGSAPAGATVAVRADAETEELIEAIIDEKWNELLEDVKKIVAWKAAVESVLRGLEERSKALQKNMEQLASDVHAKLGEYDGALGDLSADVKALEKVYGKILPTFVEKVNQLRSLKP